MRFRDIRAVDLLWNILVGLTVLFTVSKLSGLIDWPWWVVLSPFAVPITAAWAVFIGLFVFWFAIYFYERLREYLKDKK